jgi:protease IV
MNFLKNMLASMLGTFLALGLIVVVFVIIIVAAVAGSDSEKTTKVRENSVLKITLDGIWTERTAKSEINFGGDFGRDSQMGLDQFIKVLAKAKTDDKIKGIFLDVKSAVAAPSTLLDVRNALVDFKTSGKWILAYSEDYGQGSYYVASVADEVYLYPTGSFDWRGINSEVVFFKKMLDNLGIEAQVIRGPNNKFKSAVEPFLYESMSPESKAQIATYVGDIWRIMREGIGQSRNLTPEQLNEYADSLSAADAVNAQRLGLVTALKYPDEIMKIMKTKVGLAEDAADKDLKMVKYAEYAGTVKEEPKADAGKIAVVYAVGDIESGYGNDETIGSDRIAKALREAREDEEVKAIVFRVNSPGGSALASDVIWRETQLIKASGKPLVVSMGDYAASGGYYISCAADKIYANPNTITGSIGVFGIVPNMQKFWNEKIGITFDQYETNPHADFMSINRPMDAAQMKVTQDMVADIYTDFITKVAQGRNMDVAKVDSIGQGRVWSGEDAKNLGLVDELGDLRSAIAAAAGMAGLTDFQQVSYPKMLDPFEEFVKELTGEKETQLMKEVLGDAYSVYEKAKNFTQMSGIQARLPYMITFH